MKLFSNHIYKLKASLLLVLFVIIVSPFNSFAQNFITPDVLTELDENLNETSGLINLDGEIWTHNDKGGEAKLYQIDVTNGSILRTVTVQNATNIDWEDLANDEVYAYVGDIGNNDGSRTDLKIYKISRYALQNYDEVYADVINYSYSDQNSFEPNYHNTNFDCEALVSYMDHLFLCTKNWVDYQTKCYKLSNQPGTHVAEYQATFDVNCLITGAETDQNSNLLSLIGYNLNGGSYTWLFDDFLGENFFEGDDTKLIWTSLTQIEGICKKENNDFYISSEKFPGFSNPILYYMDVSSYLTVLNSNVNSEIRVYYNQNTLIINSESNSPFSGVVQIINMTGNTVTEFGFTNQTQLLTPLNLPKGIYLITLISDREINTTKIIVP